MTPEQVQARLAYDLPPATLVLGPRAWQEVCRCARGHWMLQPDLDARTTRMLSGLAWLLPTSGGERVMALNLAGASTQVQNMLLKTLEEPPESTRFVLAAEKPPLPTVMSRCRVLQLGGRLDDPPSPEDAALVASVLRAARTGNTALAARAVREWSPRHAALLSRWAAEAASGRWRAFSAAAVPGVSASQARQLLTELSRYPGARNGPLAALSQVFGQG